jgi:hypothetical protein
MAVVKFINGKNEKIAGMVRAIDYITNEDKTEIFLGNGIENLSEENKEMLFVEKLIDEDKTNRAINYITKDEKTSEHLITGINCNAESPYNDMMITKRMYNKERGRQFIHFVHSFSDKEDITPEIAHEISLKLIEHAKFEGFQILAATHTDRKHLHTHFILNTVNLETGKKWQLSTNEVKELIRYSNKLCKEYNLKYSFANVNDNSNSHRQTKSHDSGELRAKKQNRSWKHELSLAIDKCRKLSKSREEFIKNMEELNYKVKWADTRKYITFTTPTRKLCRNIKLENSENYTKEALEKDFLLNQQIYNFSKEKENENNKTEQNSEQRQKKNNWKSPLYDAIKQALKISTSREEFIQYMEKKGYKVRWEDSRKNITFTFSNGRKCNNDKLYPPENFTKKALERKFSSNEKKTENHEAWEKKWKEKGDQFRKEQSIYVIKNLLIETSKMLEQNPEGGDKNYPLSYLEKLEGEVLKEKMKEKSKGEGLNWERGR